jgi:short-subunit dehydrogenase
MSTYGASKAFALSFALALAEELRGSGVHARWRSAPARFERFSSRRQHVAKSSVVSFASLDAHTVVERALGAYARRAVLIVRAARLTMTGLGRIAT